MDTKENILSPTFKLILHKSYYKFGFFNVPVEFDKLVGGNREQIKMQLGNTEGIVIGRIDRNANINETARIYGGTALKEWFTSNYKIGDMIEIYLLSPTSLKIGFKIGTSGNMLRTSLKADLITNRNPLSYGLPPTQDILEKINVNWVEIVCRSSYWVSKDIFDYITENNRVNVPGVFYPYCVRKQSIRSPKWIKDKGRVIYLDLNHAPQKAMGLIVSGKTFQAACEGYACCHIYGNPYTKDWKSFTCVGNLILIPKELKSFTDHHKEVMECLKYIAYKRYNWSPENDTPPSKDYTQYIQLINEIPPLNGFDKIYNLCLEKYRSKCLEAGLEPPF